MDKKFVKIRFDVRCDWEAFPPEYRIFVNDELFTERTFKLKPGKQYIKEMLQIEAVPGEYTIRFEELLPHSGNFTIGKPYVQHGPAEITDDNRIIIS